MRRVSVTELKNRLSQYLRLVKRGETILVLERSIPVARLQSVGGKDADADSPVERLVRDGIITRPVRTGGVAALRKPPIPCRGDIVQALIEERDR
ncbi:MAG: type II toxin-antitoxin system Phd/YefM family antitoxin [Candidatus Eiseniibacteriota bacterium]